MATETQTAPAPQLTVLTRVASIPLISDSLAAIDATLASNAYTKAPYSAAQAIGSRAYSISEPIQARLAPVINRADGFANKAIDVVENRYPYPFRAPTEEIYGTLKQHSEHAVGIANKTIDERVRSPAFAVVQTVDQSFTPVVDRFESVVNKINGKADSPGPDSPVEVPKDKFQYQRAYRLSMDLKDLVYVYTNDQIKQIQEHNVLVQRATTTARNISTTLSTSYGAASQRVHSLSDSMLSELHSLQASAAALPAQAQASLHGLSERVGTVIGEVTNILRSEAPVTEKLAKLRVAVEQQVQPLLNTASATAYGAMKAVRGEKPNGVADTITVNGEGAIDGNGTNGTVH